MATKPSNTVSFFIQLGIMWLWWKEYIFRVLDFINWPVVGMLPGLLRNASRVHEFATQLLKHSGGTFVFKGPWFTGMDFVLTSDHNNVQHIVSKNFANYDKGPEYKEIFEAIGDGIFNVDGDPWRTQRRILHNLFKDSRFVLARNRATQKKISDGLFAILDQASQLHKEVDAQELFRRLTFDATCMLLLGYDPKCLSLDLPEVGYEKAYCIMEEAALVRHVLPMCVWKLCRWLQIGEERALRRAWDTFDNFLFSCISRKREKMARQGTTPQEEMDLLSLLMGDPEEKNPGRGQDNYYKELRELGKSDKLLRDIAFSLVAAGRDTLSAGLSWLLWVVATHPYIEAKIIEEMRGSVSSVDCQQHQDGHKNLRIFEEEELSKLTYLNACVHETLRLYPPLPLNHKFSLEADTLPSGLHVPKNTRIIYSLYTMGRMESVWGEDCLEFKPERWITETGNIKHVPFHKLAFSAGPRICLGKRLALFQIMTIAAAVIWNYQLRVVDGCHVCPASSIVLHMKYGLKVRVSKRWVGNGKCTS